MLVRLRGGACPLPAAPSRMATARAMLLRRWASRPAATSPSSSSTSSSTQSTSPQRSGMTPVLVEGVRTPFAPSQGDLASLWPHELQRMAFWSLLDRTRLPPSHIDYVVAGTVIQVRWRLMLVLMRLCSPL